MFSFFHLAFFVLLPFPLGRGDVFCAEETLIDAYENPTAYCQLSGMYTAIMILHL